ncbi:pseudouridine synthase [Deltaproteobacteria bacterium TL4]
MKKFQISESIRIQKVISQAGVASRREAERLILQGEVTLNGKVVSTLGERMIPGVDFLEVSGQKIHNPQKIERVVYALNKPRNCITTLDDPEGRTTIKDFFPETNKRLFPVGRLDYDAEGLILITNDGEFANQMMHPHYKVWKSYFVKVKGIVAPKSLYPLKKGPVIHKQKHLPVKVKVLHNINNKTWLDVSLQQGTNQQIKKMFAQLGYNVEKIKRYRIGEITLEELMPGQSRKLSKEDISKLITN